MQPQHYGFTNRGESATIGHKETDIRIDNEKGCN